MKKAKAVPGATIRRVWRMNPVTRVHDNDIRKDGKRERRETKKRLAEELRDNRRPFVIPVYTRIGKGPRRSLGSKQLF